MNIEKDGCSVAAGNSFEVYSMVRMMIMLVSGRKTVRGIRVRVEAIQKFEVANSNVREVYIVIVTVGETIFVC